MVLIIEALKNFLSFSNAMQEGISDFFFPMECDLNKNILMKPYLEFITQFISILITIILFSYFT